MGRATPTSDDDVLRKSEAALTGAGQATPWEDFSGEFNLHLSGTFVATLVVERSFDGGATAVGLTRAGSPVSFSAPASEVLKAPEVNVLYRVRCTAFTSGTVQARLSQ